MRPHADDTAASYRAALLAAFDGPIPDDCRAALERLEHRPPQAAADRVPSCAIPHNPMR